MGIKVVLCTYNYTETHACIGVGRHGLGYRPVISKGVRNEELLILYKRHKRKEI